MPAWSAGAMDIGAKGFPKVLRIFPITNVNYLTSLLKGSLSTSALQKGHC